MSHPASTVNRLDRLPREEVNTVPKSKGSGGQRGRSAITGRFVKQTTVQRNPKTTVNESTKKSGKK